ncbi:hypothetical protein BH09PAT3_BH09PAT3_2190 [soil metagenome]
MQDNLEPMANSPEPTGVSIHSGFPNPAADSHGRPTALALDLNQLLIRHPSSTFLFRIRGESWTAQGIFDGDIAIIDRALQANGSDLVLIWLDETFEIHRYSSIKTNQHIWGVVSSIIHPRNQT